MAEDSFNKLILEHSLRSKKQRLSKDLLTENVTSILFSIFYGQW